MTIGDIILTAISTALSAIVWYTATVTLLEYVHDDKNSGLNKKDLSKRVSRKLITVAIFTVLLLFVYYGLFQLNDSDSAKNLFGLLPFINDVHGSGWLVIIVLQIITSFLLFIVDKVIAALDKSKEEQKRIHEICLQSATVALVFLAVFFLFCGIFLQNGGSIKSPFLYCCQILCFVSGKYIWIDMTGVKDSFSKIIEKMPKRTSADRFVYEFIVLFYFMAFIVEKTGSLATVMLFCVATVISSVFAMIRVYKMGKNVVLTDPMRD